jgi:hypothetical protein
MTDGVGLCFGSWMYSRVHFYFKLVCESMGVGTALSVQRQATGWSARVQFPAVQYFSFHRSVQTGSGADPASCPMGTVGSFPGVKRQGREAVHSPPSSAEVKNGGAVPPLPRMPSWYSAKLNKHGDNFTFIMWIYTSILPYVFMVLIN